MEAETAVGGAEGGYGEKIISTRSVRLLRIGRFLLSGKPRLPHPSPLLLKERELGKERGNANANPPNPLY